MRRCVVDVQSNVSVRNFRYNIIQIIASLRLSLIPVPSEVKFIIDTHNVLTYVHADVKIKIDAYIFINILHAYVKIAIDTHNHYTR